MSLLYVKTNLVNLDSLPDNTYVSTEDTVYTVDKLYNKRPSYPFRFTAKANQYIKIAFSTPRAVTFAGIFNHNLLSTATIDLQASTDDITYVYVSFLGGANWRKGDLYKTLEATYKYFKLQISDPANPSIPQIGELVLGNGNYFENAWVQPGRSDGPVIHASNNITHYGQDWSNYYSDAEAFSITLKNLNDPNLEDDLQTFLKAVWAENDGKFIIVPDHRRPHVYYIQVVNRDSFADREIYGVKELRNWRLEIKTLTRGITLL